MKRSILTLTALLALAAPASAYESRTVLPNGDVYSSSCYRGEYGWQCRGWYNGTGNSPQIIRVQPEDYTPNTNPNWGKGCRSCDTGGVK